MIKTIKNRNFSKVKNIKYAFFTRHGGFSSGEFESLNFNSSPSGGELNDNIIKNLNVIKQYFHSPYNVLKLKEIHSNKVYVFNDLSILPSVDKIEADALVTKIKNLVIGISTADCVPILFSDEKNEIIAAAHAGWKGAIAGVIENTIDEMIKIGSNIKEIKAVIGPHLKVDNFEVKDDFIKILENNNLYALKFVLKKDNKFFFDITKFVKNILKNKGVNHIYNVNLDTYTNPELFFSYRRSCHQKKDKLGCHFSAIMLK